MVLFWAAVGVAPPGRSPTAWPAWANHAVTRTPKAAIVPRAVFNSLARIMAQDTPSASKKAVVETPRAACIEAEANKTEFRIVDAVSPCGGPPQETARFPTIIGDTF